MGSISVCLNFHETPNQHFRKLCTFENDYCRCRLLASACKHQVFYGAMEQTPKTPQDNNHKCRPQVIAIVILWHWHGRFGEEMVYKEMSELCGPCETTCPDSILDLLSPLEELADPSSASYRWAADWRQACRAYNQRRRLTHGQGAILRYPEPIKFTNGCESDTFMLTRSGRRYSRTRFAMLNEEELQRLLQLDQPDWERQVAALRSGYYTIRSWADSRYTVLRPGVPLRRVRQLQKELDRA